MYIMILKKLQLHDCQSLVPSFFCLTALREVTFITEDQPCLNPCCLPFIILYVRSFLSFSYFMAFFNISVQYINVLWKSEMGQICQGENDILRQNNAMDKLSPKEDRQTQPFCVTHLLMLDTETRSLAKPFHLF